MVITFGVSWACWGTAIGLGGPATPGTPTYTPFLLGAFGPLTGALVIRVRRKRRGEPVPAHAVRFRPAALLQAPLLMLAASGAVLAAAALGHAAGDTTLSWSDAQDVMKDMGGPAAFLVSMIISGPLSEEPGWRGTAYPRMRATMGRFQIALVLGVVWAVWHLPLFFIDGTVQNDLGLATPSGVLFAVGNIPMAMLVTCAYERAGILASIAVHFAVNTTMVLLNVHTPATQALITGCQILLIALLLLTGRRTQDTVKL
ncbi:CPBP family intramembrane metalloprotease [Streptomyces sp. A73]|uniref:CPBP family intramembrane glutamic endopeptidase n=2 Tax=Streptomyces TaxID=1883 RepID=UPI0016101C5C|nr:CPBP family intramembrane glutamic endopeptidase [Streptomyces sp. B15]MBQ0868166.1 CPBP family intramembrane metalloprotease [Streptomyces sp. RK75]MBQ1121283.1 CPBP family intramembrane metalloprotease [Streptomyces sp. B15]MBQ1156761.1 CPBP family intramembrane metalloprotease [Streptomyces sp. A73]